ncbi:methyl-accepting chemotaxis protein [Nitrincola schmidtii]|uniref:methyl-accepting chemotaxis protein n=1 Tax=Nitrincola schmidtii TaxID=1730894 RepID=UPI00124D2C0D|nr:methyl-accepting chemotaxis protein [Nitrincola schmidtii]
MSENTVKHSGFTFRDRILFTLAIPITALLLLAVYAWLQFGSIYSNVQTIYEDRVIPLKELKIIADDYAVLVIDAVNKANAGMISAESAANDIRSAQKRIEETWNRYLQTSLTEDESRLVMDAAQLFSLADSDIESVLRRLDSLSGDVKGQLDTYDGPLYNSIDPISEKITELADLQLSVAEEKYLLSKEAFVRVKQTTIVILIVALSISLVAVLNLYRWLIRQVGSEPSLVVNVTSQIAAGNLSVSMPEKIPSGSIMEAIKKLQYKMNPVVSDLQLNSQQLLSLSNELSSIEQSANTKVKKQQDETLMVATAMSEMSATVAEVANNAIGAADSSKKAEFAVNEGANVIEDVISSIESLVTRLEQVTYAVNSVESGSEQIGGIVNVIRGISEQTNLLALNASIEAARAGDAGRGFAVVADEVRNLSIRTRESTEQINTMIKTLQDNVLKSVDTVDLSLKQASSAVQLSNNAREKFEHIKQSVTDIMDMNTQIASAAEQQSQVASEIDQNVSIIKQVAIEVCDDFVRISKTEADINLVMKNLSCNAEYFKA